MKKWIIFYILKYNKHIKMLKWDGTYLGRHDKKIIIQEWKYNGKNAYKLNINNNIFDCFGFTSNNLDQCIIDELKPLFKLNKIGTHYLYLGKSNKYFIILKPTIFLNNIKISAESDKLEIQKIYLFRLIVGLTHIYDNNIIISDNIYYSIHDYNIKYDKTELPDSILKRWFKDNNIYLFSKQLFKISNEKHLNKFINMMSIKMEEVIKNVNNDSIFYKDNIINKLHTLLNFDFNYDNDTEYTDIYTPLK